MVYLLPLSYYSHYYSNYLQLHSSGLCCSYATTLVPIASHSTYHSLPHLVLSNSTWTSLVSLFTKRLYSYHLGVCINAWEVLKILFLLLNQGLFMFVIAGECRCNLSEVGEIILVYMVAIELHLILKIFCDKPILHKRKTL